MRGKKPWKMVVRRWKPWKQIINDEVKSMERDDNLRHGSHQSRY